MASEQKNFDELNAATALTLAQLQCQIRSQQETQILTHTQVGSQDTSLHCVKSVRIRSFSGLHLPTFALNAERYGVSLCIQSKCGKIRTRKTTNTDTFRAVIIVKYSSSTTSFSKRTVP